MVCSMCFNEWYSHSVQTITVGWMSLGNSNSSVTSRVLRDVRKNAVAVLEVDNIYIDAILEAET